MQAIINQATGEADVFGSEVILNIVAVGPTAEHSFDFPSTNVEDGKIYVYNYNKASITGLVFTGLFDIVTSYGNTIYLRINGTPSTTASTYTYDYPITIAAGTWGTVPIEVGSSTVSTTGSSTYDIYYQTFNMDVSAMWKGNTS